MNPAVKPFYTALNEKCAFEVVNDHLTTGQLRVMGRVHANGMRAWLEVMERLSRFSNPPWTMDLSKQYFPNPSGTGMLYGWRIIVQASSILTHIPALTQLVAAAPVFVSSVGQVQEVPLHGSPMRHLGPNQKGARPLREG